MKKIIILSIALLLSVLATEVKACGTSSTLCAGTTTSLSNFYGGTWSSSNTAVATVSASGVVTAVAPGTATITNTYTTGLSFLFGPTVATTGITVNGVPTGVSATATPNAMCVGAKLTLTGAATGATSYAWTAPGGAAITAATSLSAYVNAVTAANAGVYTLSATNSCGTVKVATGTVAIATAAPTAVTATATPVQICAGTALTLTGAATGATSYSWAAPGGASVPAAQNSSVAAIATTNAGVYTVTATNACGSTKATSSSVSVTASLPASVTATATPANLCAGSALTLAGSATGAITYSWAGPGGSSVATPASANTSVSSVTAANSGAYTLSATNVCGTVRASSLAVAVTTGLPSSLTATATPSQICSGSTLTLTGTANGATTYSWTAPGGAALVAPSSLNTSVAATTTGNAGVYTLSATNICGTSKAVTGAVLITAGVPTGVTASAASSLICSGSALAFTGTANNATSYSWTSPGGAALVAATSLNPSVPAATAGNSGIYTFSATNICGTATATTTVGVSQSPSVSGSVSDVSCNGYSNGDVILGNIVISVAASSGGYSCLWSNGSTSTYGTFGLAAGTYSVTVTDNGGCATTQACTVSQPTPITAVTTIANSGSDDASGEIDLVVSGGTAPYTYSWSNGTTSPDATGLSHGDYCVAVSDANSCAFNDCYFVNNANGNARHSNNGTNDSTATTASTIPVVTKTAAYPNPFTSTTNISFSAPTQGHTTVEVFNAVNGEKVATIFDEVTTEGTTYSCVLDGENLPSGLYIYKISSENSSYIGKVTLAK